MESDVHHVQALKSSYCDESLEYHLLLELEVTFCGVPITCLIDSGSTHNFIDRRTLDKIGLRAITGNTLEVVLADGSKISVDNVCHIPIQFNKQIRQAVVCHVVENLSSSLILGMQWLADSNPTIRWPEYEVDLQYGQLIVILKGQANKRRLPKIKLCSAKAGIKAIRKGEQAWFMMLCTPNSACLQGVDSMQDNGTVVHDQSSTPALAQKWQATLTEYADVFEQPGKPVSIPVDHRIGLVDPNSVPPKPCLYQMLEDELQAVKNTIDDYLARGWIRPSSSNYGAPVIVIRKITGELHIVIDYRLLSKQTRLDSYPILRIDELLDRHAHAKYFTKIELASGYHQIKMADRHVVKTAFLTRYGTYEWQILPLGLTNAPATFQRFMNGLFDDFLDKTLLVYLDNLLVYSETDVHHLEDIKQVLQHLHNNQLKAKRKKCDFNARQVDYLRHIVSKGMVAIDPAKILAVKEWPCPTNVKQLQSYLGFCNYYNRFIKGYSQIIAPLTQLLQKDASFT